MTLTDYLEPRVFRSPYLKRTESVSGSAVLWALLLGPAYYWRKQAPVEALVLFLLDAAIILMPGRIFGIDGVDDAVGLLVWLGFALGAPALLSICYRRKGWVEVGRGAEARWRAGDFSGDEADAAMVEDVVYQRRDRATVNRGGKRDRLPLS
jgi:hypothetical protein